MEFVALIVIGFLAQLVDGALGMAFGLVSTTALLMIGVPPAQSSAAVHTAEVATTAASGISHILHGNIEWRLFGVLAAAGIVGGVLGAYVLSNIDGHAVRPWIALYLLVMGLFILRRAWFGSPSVAAEPHPSRVVPLGVGGGFLDAIGGGGWGPIVSSTLIGSGHAPRKVIGSVNAAEFFVTVAVATTFFVELGIAHAQHILALIIGGLLAAPLGAYVVRYVSARTLMTLVGTLVSLLAVIQLWRSLV